MYQGQLFSRLLAARSGSLLGSFNSLHRTLGTSRCSGLHSCRLARSLSLAYTLRPLQLMMMLMLLLIWLPSRGRLGAALLVGLAAQKPCMTGVRIGCALR